MQAELESNLREREATLLTQLAAQKESLLNEKKQVCLSFGVMQTLCF